MAIQRFTMEEIQDADDNYEGFCISCGDSAQCCEPDAREYECDSCGEKKVYGAMELVMMGLVD